MNGMTDTASVGRLTQDVMSALADGEIRFPRCGDCEHLQWPPDIYCANCGSSNMGLSEPTTATGEVWSLAEYHRAYQPHLADDVPYVVAMVRLDNGLDIVGRLKDIRFENVTSGTRVRGFSDAVGPGLHSISFRPAAFPA